MWVFLVLGLKHIWNGGPTTKYVALWRATEKVDNSGLQAGPVLCFEQPCNQHANLLFSDSRNTTESVPKLETT